ncbi:MAG TPA: hypothetical protein VK939_03320 [Longimicrobiales bacterium]|nr:hypothetical protein [Longimicrobiales bacterium]
MSERNDSYERVRDEAIDASRRPRRDDEPLVASDRDRRDPDLDETGALGGRKIEPEAPLFSPEETDQLRTRWESVQASFVDEPRRAVEEADGLVRTVMDRLTDGFSDQRERLEREWGTREEISTEDLRMALRHYRSFFDRLLRL